MPPEATPMLTVASTFCPATTLAADLKRLAHALGRDAGIGEIARQHCDEFLAAEPADHVAGPEARRERRRKGPQHLVAERVTEAVVERLEVVEVEHQDAHRLLPLGLAMNQVDGRRQRSRDG